MSATKAKPPARSKPVTVQLKMTDWLRREVKAKKADTVRTYNVCVEDHAGRRRPRFRVATDKLPPRDDGWVGPYLEPDLWEPLSKILVEEIAAEVLTKPLPIVIGERLVGRPQTNGRARWAATLAAHEYELWTGQQPSKSNSVESAIYGPYVRFLQAILDRIGSKAKVSSLVAFQQGTGRRSAQWPHPKTIK